MGKIKDLVRHLGVSFMLGMNNVERSVFVSDKDVAHNAPTIKQQKLNLADALEQQQLTEEVKDFRWRMYKIIDNVSKVNISKDSNGKIITESRDFNNEIRRVLIDNHDDYKLSMVINNHLDDDSDEFTFKIKYGTIPRLDITKHISKINVRDINDNDKLIEICISKYSNEFSPSNHKLLVNKLEAKIKNPIIHIADPIEINLTTLDCLGVYDYNKIEFKELKFNKIVEFNGYYILKYRCKMVYDSVNIFEIYKQDELEKRYKTRIRKRSTLLIKIKPVKSLEKLEYSIKVLYKLLSDKNTPIMIYVDNNSNLKSDIEDLIKRHGNYDYTRVIECEDGVSDEELIKDGIDKVFFDMMIMISEDDKPSFNNFDEMIKRLYLDEYSELNSIIKIGEVFRNEITVFGKNSVLND